MSSKLLKQFLRLEPIIYYRSVLKLHGISKSSTPMNSIRKMIEATGGGAKDQEELSMRLHAGEPLYPNCDTSMMMRSCEQEVLQPISGITKGSIPKWVKGTLLRNGPGCQGFGETKYQHWFDGAAMVHRFAIEGGEVTYQCRFLKTNTYLKNKAANRIVVSEFGTATTPDPCQTIFQRVSSLFNPGDSVTDNAVISIYPFGDEYYCFTETPTIHRIDPVTLDTMGRVDVTKHVGIMNHTSHPHVTYDGSVYNQAMGKQGLNTVYSIVKFPSQDDKPKDRRPGQMFESAEIVASVRARWPLHPSYMHTFGLTDNYYIIVEQPLAISLPSMVKSKLKGEALNSCLKYFENEQTFFHIVERSSGNLFRTFKSEAFFYFHIINQFESDGHLVIDICCYSDAAMIDCMYRDALEDMQKNPDYAQLSRGRPLRFVLPLAPPIADSASNLVTLDGSSAGAWWQGDEVLVRPELLCERGCELPRINYSHHLGKPYRYFYAVSSDVDLNNPGTLIKVDTHTRTTQTWREPGIFPSEPVFVPSPDSQAEDDGVILCTQLWGQGHERQVGLLVLDARTLQELGRTVFHTPSPVPKCLHGWFAAEV